MADAARARKLGERFQEIVAETLEMKVKDPPPWLRNSN
jgi:ribosome-binding factor A